MRPRRPGARHLRLQDDPPWDASAYLNTPDSAATHFVEQTEQAANLVAHDEISQSKLWSWPFVRIQLHISQRYGPRIEYWLGVFDLEILDAAMVDGLAQTHQSLAGRRKA